MDFTHQLLAHLATEIKPLKHDELIYFVLLIFRPRLRKLNANRQKLNITIGIMEPVWKKKSFSTPPPPLPRPPPLEFPGPLSPDPSGNFNFFGRGRGYGYFL